MRLPVLACVLMLLFSSCAKDKIDVISSVVSTPIAETINDFYFVNDTLAFATGGERYVNGFILKSTDAGNSWQLTDGLSNTTFFGISFLNEQYGEAAGYAGKIARTEDGGATWSVLQYHTFERLNHVVLFSEQATTICGGDGYNEGFALNTSVNWWQFEREDYEPVWLSSEKISNTEAYLSGFGALLKSEDSGNTWQYIDLRGDFYSGISFPSPETGYVCGLQGSIKKTEDSGATWSRLLRVNGAFGKRAHYTDIDFFDNNVGVVVGYDGLVLITNNGGLDWALADINTGVDLNTVQVTSLNSAIAAGDDGVIIKVQF